MSTGVPDPLESEQGTDPLAEEAEALQADREHQQEQKRDGFACQEATVHSRKRNMDGGRFVLVFSLSSAGDGHFPSFCLLWILL